MSARPPSIPRALLRRLLAARDRELILDDLAEEYRSLVSRHRGDRRAARRWYWGEALRSVRPALRHRRELRRARGGHAADRSDPVDTVATELRQAVHRLATAPGFTLAAVVTLALGVGGSSAIFTLVNGVLLRPLPYREPGRLVWVGHTAPGLGVDEMLVSYGVWKHYTENTELMESFGLLQNVSANLTEVAEPERLGGMAVTHNLFETLGVRPVLGRGFTPADDRHGAPPVVILSHGLWQRRFGGDPAIVGQTIQLNARPREVIGVMPEGFAFPRPGVEVWFAMQVPPEDIRFGGFYRAGYARLRPDVSVEQLRDELDALIPRLTERYDLPAELIAEARIAALVEPLQQRMVGDVGRSLWILLGTVGVVLVIACSNVANLFLVRAEGRHREVAVRQALGASRGQMVRYFLSESAVLAGAGWLGGLAVAWLAVRLLVTTGVDIPRLHEVGVDGVVVLVGGLLATAAGVLFGALPLMRFGRLDLVTALKDDARAATASQGRQRGRSLMVATQVALGLTLLVVSTLMARSLWQLVTVDLGFRPERVLSAEVVLPERSYSSRAAISGFYYTAMERLDALPGVTAVAVASELPLANTLAVDPLYREGIDDPDSSTLPPTAHYVYVTPSYFEVMGMPLLRGRLFEAADAGTAAMVITRSLGEQFWPGESPIGKQARQDWMEELPWRSVVGVVGDFVHGTITEPGGPAYFYPMLPGDNAELPFLPSVGRLLLRTSGDPAALVSQLQAAVREIDPNLPIANIRPIEDLVRDATARPRFTLTLLVVATGVAVFLGAVGLYGVISYTVSQRTREIGLRMALGARRNEVRGMVLRQGLAVALVGLAGGLSVSMVVTRVLQSQLFEVSATDPATFMLTPLLLLVVAAVAVWVPAARASRVDPVEGLRAE